MLLDDLVALLVGKVFSAVLCALMDTGTPLIEFFSFWRFFGSPLTFSLSFGQVLFLYAEEARILMVVPSER